MPRNNSQGMAGASFYTHIDTLIDVRSYIQTELSQPLEKDKQYYVEFYINLGNGAGWGTDCIGVHFSDTAVYRAPDYFIDSTGYFIKPIMLSAQVRNPAGNIIMDTAGWTKISGTFTAAGGERYMVIGSFWREAQCNAIQLGSEYGGGYYFIDDVLVCACEDTATEQPVFYMPNIFSPNGDGQNDVLYLRAEKVRESELVIYNRWGEEVFRSSSQQQGWDGRAGGRDCEAGVYVWHVRLVYENGASLSRAGNVSLVR